MRRPWNHYFMDMAKVVSNRGTCDRARVGCVLVVERRVIATGYNGASPGLPHCDEVGHDMDNGRCIRTLHAEENALLQCAKYGLSARGATCYCTHEPCYKCTQKLHAAGVELVFFDSFYTSMSFPDRDRIKMIKNDGHGKKRISIEILIPLAVQDE